MKIGVDFLRHNIFPRLEYLTCTLFFFREKCLVSELLSIFYGSHFKTAKTKTSVSTIMFPINCQMFIVLYNIFRGKRNGNDVVLVSLLVILNMFHMFYYFCC